MKQVFLTISILFLIIFHSSAQYQTNCISTDGDTMTFRVVGYGKNAKAASNAGELSVIKALMYQGIPNTQQSVPMVPETENTVLQNHKSYLQSFYDGNYKNVITRSVIVRKFEKDENKQKSLTLEVTVNIRALRTELERNGLIRKFGL